MPHITLWDSVSAHDVPPSRDAYAGYVDGEWRSYQPMRQRFGPKVPVLSITTTGRVPAMVGDVENGDLSYPGAARWLEMMHRQGYRRPCLYTSLYAADLMVPTLASLGHPRENYRLWLAHWTESPHICGRQCGWTREPPGATQWTATAPRPWHADLSLTTPGWVHAVVHEFHRPPLGAA